MLSCLLLIFINLFSSDLYEGTRMARETDLSGIRQIIKPLEESGTLVKRTEQEVMPPAFLGLWSLDLANFPPCCLLIFHCMLF